MLDTRFLTSVLEEAAKQGVMRGGEVVAGRARSLVPVRRIFASKRGKGGRGAHGDQSYWRVRSGQFVGRPVFQTTTVNGGLWKGSRASLVGADHIPRFTGRVGLGILGNAVDRRKPSPVVRFDRERVSGRVNSYAPVVSSPAGFIGGSALRSWSRGKLEVQRVRGPRGSFSVDSLLTSRGRYEVRTGRAVTTTPSGEKVVGGRLHDSIRVDGPFADEQGVYALVSASAHDPGRPSHNYARDQEFGSRHNRKHPFLRPALRQSREAVFSASRGAIGGAFRNAPQQSRHYATRRIIADVSFTFTGVQEAVKEIEALLPPVNAAGQISSKSSFPKSLWGVPDGILVSSRTRGASQRSASDASALARLWKIGSRP